MDTMTSRCPICDGTARLVREKRSIRYGHRRVVVDDELMRCEKCDETFYEQGQMDATDARAAAKVREEQGALLPFEIRAIRDSYGMTQAQFEAVLRVGAKTVVRWERGLVTPNAATNTLLRLLQSDPRTMSLLREMSGVSEPEPESAPVPAPLEAQPAETASYRLPRPRRTLRHHKKAWAPPAPSHGVAPQSDPSDEFPYLEAVG
jgi:putative zinc finger/helix-turn-helix YgiT family protein